MKSKPNGEKYIDYDDFYKKTNAQLIDRNVNNIIFLKNDLEIVKDLIETIIDNPDFSGYYTKDEIDDMLLVINDSITNLTAEDVNIKLSISDIEADILNIQDSLDDVNENKLDIINVSELGEGKIFYDSSGYPFMHFNGETETGFFQVNNKGLKFYYTLNGEAQEYIPISDNDLTPKSYIDNGLNEKVNNLYGNTNFDTTYFNANVDNGIYVINFENAGLETESKHGTTAINELHSEININTGNISNLTQIVNNLNKKFTATVLNITNTYLTFNEPITNEFDFTFENNSTLIGVDTSESDITIGLNIDPNTEITINWEVSGNINQTITQTSDSNGDIIISIRQVFNSNDNYRISTTAENLNSGAMVILGNITTGEAIESSQMIDDHIENPTSGINIQLTQVDTNKNNITTNINNIDINTNNISTLQSGKINALGTQINLLPSHFGDNGNGIYPSNVTNTGLTTTSSDMVGAINEINTKVNNLAKGEILIWDGGIGSDIDEVTFTMPEGYTYLYTLIYHYYTGGSYIAHGLIKIDKLNTEYINHFEGGAGTNTLLHNADGTWTLETDSSSDNLYQIWGIK